MRLDAGERREATVELRLFLRPQRPDRFDVLGRADASFLVWNADRIELAPHVADTDPEDEPPLGENVDPGQLLGQDDRVALRQEMIPLASLTRSVCAAAKASAAMVSSMSVSGAAGEGGSWGSIRTTCSPVQTDS